MNIPYIIFMTSFGLLGVLAILLAGLAIKYGNKYKNQETELKKKKYKRIFITCIFFSIITILGVFTCAARGLGINIINISQFKLSL